MMPCYSHWDSALTGNRALYPLQALECLSPKDVSPKGLQWRCTLAQSIKPMSQFSSSPSETRLYSGVLTVSWLMEMTKPSPKWCSSHAVAGTEWGLSWWVTPAGWHPDHKTHLLLVSMWTTAPTRRLLMCATRNTTYRTISPSSSASICLMSTTAMTHRGLYAVLSLYHSETLQQARNSSPTTTPSCIRFKVHATVLLWCQKTEESVLFFIVCLA